MSLCSNSCLTPNVADGHTSAVVHIDGGSTSDEIEEESDDLPPPPPPPLEGNIASSSPRDTDNTDNTDAWTWTVRASSPGVASVVSDTDSSLLTTPAASVAEVEQQGGDMNTWECMFQTLEQTLACFNTPLMQATVSETGRNDLGELFQAPRVWVVKYCDYTSKYGMGYLFNTGSVGVCFNDSTKIILSDRGGVFQYFERNRGSNENHFCQTHTLDSFPDGLTKKVTLLKHFKIYLLDLLDQSKENNSDRCPPIPAFPSELALQLMRLGTRDEDVAGEGCAANAGDLAYVKKWVRTRHAILFRLSNNTVQVVFFDHSEVLLAEQARVVCFVSKEGHRSEHTLDEVFRSKRADIVKRLKYTKEIMSKMIDLQLARR